ncbi:hypothetical protein PCL_02897 [Purpureocillium lilacinum]|uniref:Uncharacterized protein n=1 Tax=Purpureocillium lilacinum TaxID=33203 RepID=A0A2U3DZ77_PURLI|nr:hypothetical protein PCL_02897 [Purpureocillium lilacinum]
MRACKDEYNQPAWAPPPPPPPPPPSPPPPKSNAPPTRALPPITGLRWTPCARLPRLVAGTSSGAAPPRTTDGPPAARAGQTGRPSCNVQHATGSERPLAGSHPSMPFSPYEYCTLQYTLCGGIAGPALPSRSPADSGSDARRPGHGGGRRDRAIASAPGVRSTAGTASRLLRRAGTSARRAQAWKHAGSRQARLIFYRDVQLLRTYSLHLWPALLHHAAAGACIHRQSSTRPRLGTKVFHHDSAHAIDGTPIHPASAPPRHYPPTHPRAGTLTNYLSSPGCTCTDRDALAAQQARCTRRPIHHCGPLPPCRVGHSPSVPCPDGTSLAPWSFSPLCAISVHVLPPGQRGPSRGTRTLSASLVRDDGSWLLVRGPLPSEGPLSHITAIAAAHPELSTPPSAASVVAAVVS